MSSIPGSGDELQPPEEFPFPFQPYNIQKDFMISLYGTLERGNIGIFESPTGTVSHGWLTSWLTYLMLVWYPDPSTHKNKRMPLRERMRLFLWKGLGTRLI